MEQERDIAQKCTAKIKSALLQGNEKLLGLVDQSMHADVSETNEVSNDMKEVESTDVAEDDDDDEEMELPKSMQEIYKISNKNRNRTKLNQVPFPESTEDIDDIEKAEALIATSGPNGKDYFEQDSILDSKRQRIDEGEEGDLALMKSLGWVKDDDDIKSLQKSSATIETDEKKRSKQINNTGTKQSNRRDNFVPYDYSNVGQIGIYDKNGPVCDNPFFSGAAVGGERPTPQRRGGGGGGQAANKKIATGGNNNNNNNNNNKKSRKPSNNSVIRRDSNKSYVYRPG